MIHHGVEVGEGHSGPLRRWALWSIPGPARAFLLTVEVLAAALTLAALVTSPVTSTALIRFGVLLTLSVGYAEAGKRSERIRRYLGAGQSRPRPNPLSVWSFAAVLALPAGWAALFVALQYAHTIHQRWREQTSKPYRQVFVCAAAVLSQLPAAAILAAAGLHDGLRSQLLPSLAVLAAAAAFVLVDLALMLIGMWLTIRPDSVRAVLPDRDATSYEIVTVALGTTVGALLMHAPWLTVVALAPVAYVHRSAMVKALHEATRVDSKTGLLNNAAWSEYARNALSRCARSGRHASVIVLDVDHFKTINDRCGHLAGDRVLTDVARTLQRELRGHDGLGRFGGDEFVVVLEDVEALAAECVARRLHLAMGAIQLDELTPTVSLGVAHSRDHGSDLTALLTAADAALYAAKAGGRSRLCVASGR